jgi:hypothetical protein
MPLIDHNYFIGELNLPGTGSNDVQARLDLFITKYEKKFLTDLLGTTLYKSFLAALGSDPVPQAYTDLLFGADYTYSGIDTSWKGLISLPEGVLATINSANFFPVVVGGTGQYDPIVDSNTAIIPQQFVGNVVKVSRRGVGYLRSDEFTITGNVLTLTTGVFKSGETLFYEKNNSLSVTPYSALRPTSPIANYVYYLWMRNEVSQTTQGGEVIPVSENATRVSPSAKMQKAWNEMVDWCWQLVRFLDANKTDYTGWRGAYSYLDNYRYNTYSSSRMADIFYPINDFNL